MNTQLANNNNANTKPINGIDCAAKWNESKPSTRSKLLQQAGYLAHKQWSYRVWMYIPFSIREDVSAVMKHKQRTAVVVTTPNINTSAEPHRKHYWWEEKETAE